MTGEKHTPVPGPMDRMKNLLNLVKTAGTYVNKMYSELLVLRYEMEEPSAEGPNRFMQKFEKVE